MYLLEMNMVVVVVLPVVLVEVLPMVVVVLLLKDAVTTGIEVPISDVTDCVVLNNTRTDVGIPVAMGSAAVANETEREELIFGDGVFDSVEMRDDGTTVVV